MKNWWKNVPVNFCTLAENFYEWKDWTLCIACKKRFDTAVAWIFIAIVFLAIATIVIMIFYELCGIPPIYCPKWWKWFIPLKIYIMFMMILQQIRCNKHLFKLHSWKSNLVIVLKKQSGIHEWCNHSPHFLSM